MRKPPRPFSVASFAPRPATTYVLHPGDVALAFEGERLETLLGSCVAVLLTDPRRTVGAMCHIVHAAAPGAASAGDTAYAEPAMRELFRRLRAVGISPRMCQAYVAGGGNMFPELAGPSNVGNSNVQWALEFLAAQGIPVVAESVEGACYRKLGWTVGPLEPVMQSIAVVADNP